MEHTEVVGKLVALRNCERCGAALTDVDYDRAGRLVSRCPNRDDGLEDQLPPAS